MYSRLEMLLIVFSGTLCLFLTEAATTPLPPGINHLKNHFSDECTETLLAQGRYDDCSNFFNTILEFAEQNPPTLIDELYRRDLCASVEYNHLYRPVFNILEQVCGNDEANRINILIKLIRINYRCNEIH